LMCHRCTWLSWAGPARHGRRCCCLGGCCYRCTCCAAQSCVASLHLPQCVFCWVFKGENQNHLLMLSTLHAPQWLACCALNLLHSSPLPCPHYVLPPPRCVLRQRTLSSVLDAGLLYASCQASAAVGLQLLQPLGSLKAGESGGRQGNVPAARHVNAFCTQSETTSACVLIHVKFTA
jgi:hypothetical protein